MPSQSATRKRCATCNRWAGARSTSSEPGCVDIASETEPGLCVGGPWDGNERRARSACGHWVLWLALAPPSNTGNP